MKPRHRYTPSEDARIKAMWVAGEKVDYIAAKMGRSPKSIERRIRRLNLPRRLPVKWMWTDERNSQLVKLWLDGLSDIEISDRLGVSFDAMRRQCDRLKKAHPGILPHRRLLKKAA